LRPDELEEVVDAVVRRQGVGEDGGHGAEDAHRLAVERGREPRRGVDGVLGLLPQLGHRERPGGRGSHGVVGLDVDDREEERLAPGNAPTRKKNLLAGPIPFRWPTAANSPVVSRMGKVFVRPTGTAWWSYTHFHHTAVKAPNSFFSGAVGGLGLA
jgi:hypothetical protein